MAIKAPPIVRASDGRIGTILSGAHERAGAAVDVLLDDGERLLVRPEFLLEQGDGSYRLDLLTLDAEIGAGANAEAEERSAVVVPVVAETVEVGKRTVETGRVRVKKTVRSTERIVDEPVFREEVEVVRVPINRPIDQVIGPRQEGDTLIIPLLEEVLVVEKRLILREEVRITRRQVEGRDSQTVVLRSEEATIERSEADGPTDAS